MRKNDYDIDFLTQYEQFIIYYIYYNKKYKNKIKYMTRLSRDLGFSCSVITKYLNLLIKKKLHNGNI
jgi:DNA-binding MarR family transcriptional regulator